MKTRISLLIICVLFLTACLKEEPVKPIITNKIMISIGNAFKINPTTASVTGTIFNAENQQVSFGHCWDTVEIPSISNELNRTTFTSVSQDGAVNSNLENLLPDKEYFVWAYFTKDGKTIYSSPISFTTKNSDAVIDIEGNAYNWVQIGDQIWMAENLRVTKYADGIPIPLVEDNSDWVILGDNSTDKAYCLYNNNEFYKETYGTFYTWAAAMNGADSSDMNPSGVQGVCPTGWHIPSLPEWDELVETVTNDGYLGEDLKTALGWDSDVNGSNRYGFSALPSGCRYYNSGWFGKLGQTVMIFTSSVPNYEIDSEDAYTVGLNDNDSYFYTWTAQKSDGISVRCVKD